MASKKYASGTAVPVDRSLAEIRKDVTRFGASAFQFGESESAGIIAFEAKGRKVKMMLPLPNRYDRAFTHRKINQHGGEVQNGPELQLERWMQACAEHWRALAAVVKAKLIAVDAGITTFEEEFLAHVVMPDGRTVHEHSKARIEIAYTTGEVTPLLEGPRHGR